MDILLLLIPMSLVLVALIGVVFAWSVRSGQYDDLDGPAHRILADDDGAPAPAGREPNDLPALTPVNPAAESPRNMGGVPGDGGGSARDRPASSTTAR